MSGLAVNPHARIGVAEPAENGLVITVPVPGTGLRWVELGEAAPEYPAVFRFMAALRAGSAKIPSEDLSYLRQLGIVTEKDAIVPRPRLRLALSATREADTPSVADVEVELCGELHDDDPVSLRETVRTSFENGTRFWHTPVGGHAALPWWPDHDVEQALRRLMLDRRANVSSGIAKALAGAWIIRSAQFDAVQQDLAAARQRLRTRNYSSLRVLPPGLLSHVTEYYRLLIERGFLTYKDSALRYWAHNDGVGRMLHEYVHHAVESVVGRSLKTSYSYFSGYRNEALLVDHLDREQCEFTVNVVLDYRPVRDRAPDWPLVLQVGSDATEVRSGVGDSLIFKGGILSHRRPSLPAGDECDIILFHFVDRSFDGSLG